MNCHLYFFLPLYQNLRTLISEDALFAFPEIHRFRDVCQNEVTGMLLPVILIVI